MWVVYFGYSNLPHHFLDNVATIYEELVWKCHSDDKPDQNHLFVRKVLSRLIFVEFLVSIPSCLIFSANSSDEYIGKFMLLNWRYLCNIRNFRKISFFYIIISSNWIISIMKIICWKVKITIFNIKYVESQTL